MLVVEHKPETIAIADHVVDLGPRAGTEGGEVVFEGTVEGLRAGGTLTGRHLDDRASLKPSLRTPSGALEVRGASTHNLQDVDVDIPLGALVVVTGVAGSGKSSLIHGSVSGRDGVVSVDQTAIRGSRRSNPATYTGLLDPIRTSFAKANGVKPALFAPTPRAPAPPATAPASSTPSWVSWPPSSPPARSARGSGSRRRCWSTRSAAGTSPTCSRCRSPRPTEFFGDGEAGTPAAHKILASGRRRARVPQPRPAAHHTCPAASGSGSSWPPRWPEKGDVYVLDEPTTGLHLADVEHLLGLLDRLVDCGKSVIVIAHHQAVMARADWIIDLGPGAGHDGGRVVFEGTPADLVAARSTLTGRHLAAYVGS